MPGFYADGEYDVAGFIVGVVDQEKVIDGKTIVLFDSAWNRLPTLFGYLSAQLDGLVTGSYEEK